MTLANSTRKATLNHRTRAPDFISNLYAISAFIIINTDQKFVWPMLAFRHHNCNQNKLHKFAPQPVVLALKAKLELQQLEVCYCKSKLLASFAFIHLSLIHKPLAF